MKDFQTKFKLKSKEDGRLQDIYPHMLKKENGLLKWPIELDKWEVTSVHRGTGIQIPDALDKFSEAYEGDTICVMTDKPKEYKIVFKDGAFGIECEVSDYMQTLVENCFSNWQIHKAFYELKKTFVPLYFLNIGGTYNMNPAVILKK